MIVQLNTAAQGLVSNPKKAILHLVAVKTIELRQQSTWILIQILFTDRKKTIDIQSSVTYILITDLHQLS